MEPFRKGSLDPNPSTLYIPNTVFFLNPFQTPYFWPTQKWVAEDSDYGKFSVSYSVELTGSAIL